MSRLGFLFRCVLMALLIAVAVVKLQQPDYSITHFKTGATCLVWLGILTATAIMHGRPLRAMPDFIQAVTGAVGASSFVALFIMFHLHGFWNGAMLLAHAWMAVAYLRWSPLFGNGLAKLVYQGKRVANPSTVRSR